MLRVADNSTTWGEKREDGMRTGFPTIVGITTVNDTTRCLRGEATL
jgi:hypothetical protein